MKFITEFEVPNNIDLKLLNHLIPDKKHIRELGIGQSVGLSFGWQTSVNHNATNCKLEIEAFPMDKWVEFKNKILDLKLYYPSDVDLIVQYLEELESFGKPAGEAEELNK